MKLKSIYRLAFLGGLVAFAGCSGDELDGASPGNVPESVAVTLTVSRPGDASTRTVLSDNNDGTLTSTWTTGDKLLVVTSDGVKAGELTLKEGAESSTGVFTGNLTIADGTAATLWYLGASNGDTAPYTSAVVSNGDQVTLTTDLSGKENSPKLGASFHDLKRAELLKKEGVKFTVKNGVGYVKTESVLLDQMMAMAHFTLTFPDGFAVSDGATLTVNSEKGDLPNVKTWIPANSPADESYGYTFTIGDGKDIQISSNTAQLYIPIFPGSYKLTFSVNSGGKQYSCSLQEESTISAGVYYTAGAPSFAGISIDFSNPNEYPGYENEDPRNPLHKFAKTNLTRESAETNVFADANDNGALYQWGRNYGYVDSKGIYENSQMIDGSPWQVNSHFSNWIDAMGTMSYDTDNRCYGIMDYFVYSTSGQYNGCSITCGTAMHHSDLFYFDEPTFYSSVEDIKSHKYSYFMDGTPGKKIRGYGSYYFGMDELNNKPDYWVTEFGDGGSTWTERAKKCGYDNPNPCPAGWRLPTESEIREIAPEGSGLDESSGFLSSMLSGYSELRETTKGVKYAIRWLYSSDAITIEAVVVDDSYTNSSQLTSLFWDQNASSKVVRKFPFTGMIRPFVGACDTPFYQSVYICRPYHFGLADFGAWPLTVGGYDYLYGVVGTNDNNFNSGFGGYWVEEKGVAFKFATRDIASSLAYSCLLVESAEPVIGYAIRPVMDKK